MTIDAIGIEPRHWIVHERSTHVTNIGISPSLRWLFHGAFSQQLTKDDRARFAVGAP